MNLSTRMKRYEEVSHHHLTTKTPVIIRVDGKAFHTFAKHLKKPFDDDFREAMVKATLMTTIEMQGCMLTYTQSDETSFLLSDFNRIESDAWFGYDLQKIASITAASGKKI